MPVGSSNHFDLVVIGSGPAGQKGAIAAAKLGKRVAVVDRTEMIGGVCLHTGTIPSKTLREGILYLTGFRQRAFYGRDYTLKENIGIQDLTSRVATVITREMGVIREQLNRNDVTTIHGRGRFVDPHTIQVEGDRSEEHTSELQSLRHLVCRLLLEKKKKRTPGVKRATRDANRRDRPTLTELASRQPIRA